ncbi:hypothetical protein BGLA2_990009 [Burkholderia gladioli]|nr:hypothetical protein BGLA2_990009 [Burkholderia gladioli]
MAPVVWQARRRECSRIKHLVGAKVDFENFLARPLVSLAEITL